MSGHAVFPPLPLATLEQVRACALRSVVIDDEGDAWQLTTDDEVDGARVWRTGAGDAYALGLHATDAVLLHEAGPLLLVWSGATLPEHVMFEARAAARAAFAEAILHKLVEVPEGDAPVLWLARSREPYTLENDEGRGIVLTGTEATYVDLLRGDHA